MKIVVNLLCLMTIALVSSCSSGSNQSSSNEDPPHVADNKVWTDNACAKVNSGYASKWSGIANDTKITNAEICSAWYPNMKSGFANKLSKNYPRNNLLSTINSLESYTVIANNSNGANWIHFGMKLIVGESDFLDGYLNDSLNIQWSESQIPVFAINKLNIPYGTFGTNFVTVNEASESGFSLSSVYNSYYPSNTNIGYQVESMNWTGTSAGSWNLNTNSSNYQFVNLPPTTKGYYQMSNESIMAVSIPSIAQGSAYLLTVPVYLWQESIVVPMSILVTSINTGSNTATVAKLYSAYLASPSANLSESATVNPLGCTYSSSGSVESASMTCQYPNSSLTYTFSLNNLFNNLISAQHDNNVESGVVVACENSNLANGCNQNGWVLDYSVKYPNNYPSGSYLSVCANINYNTTNSPGVISANCWSGTNYYDPTNSAIYGYSGEHSSTASLNYNQQCAYGSQVSVPALGILACNNYPESDNFPSGSYTQFCYKVSYESGVLSATCSAGKVSLNYKSLCATSSQVVYLNGNLACSNYSSIVFPPQYTQNDQITFNSYLSASACYNMNYESGILSATCLASVDTVNGQLSWTKNSFNYLSPESGCQTGSALYLVSNTDSLNYVDSGSFLCESPAVGWVQQVVPHYDSTLHQCTLAINYSNNSGLTYDGATVSPIVSATNVYPVYSNVVDGYLNGPSTLEVSCTVATGMDGNDVNVCNFNPVYSLNYEGPVLWIDWINQQSGYSPNPANMTISSFGYNPITVTTELETCLATSFPSITN